MDNQVEELAAHEVFYDENDARKHAEIHEAEEAEEAEEDEEVVMGIPIDDVTAAQLIDRQLQPLHARRQDAGSVTSMASSFSSSMASSNTSSFYSARLTISQRTSQARALVASTQAFAVFGGYLRLRESSREWRMKTWYCALLRTQVYFYASKLDATRAMNLHKRVSVSSQGAAASNGQGKFHTYTNAFTFRTPRGERFFCSAPSPREQQQWIEQLNEAAKAVAANDDAKSNNSDDRMSMHGSILSVNTGDDTMDDSLDDRASSQQDNETVYSSSSSTSGSTTGCYTCGVAFGKLRHHKRTCRSCERSFCRLHCWQNAAAVGVNEPDTASASGSFIGSSGSSSSSSSSSRVCDGCSHRQHFIGFVETFTATAIRLMRHDEMNIAKASATQRDDEAQSKMRKELAIVVSNPANYTVLNVLCLLKKYVDVPWMFTRTICMLIPLYERNAAALEEYWTQFLTLFAPLLRLKEPFTQSMQFYLRFVIGVCRRNNVFALRTVWECLAIREDARIKDDRMTMSFVTLVMIACSSFDGKSTYVMRKLLADAPRAQIEAISSALQGFLAVRTVLRDDIPKSLCARWLNAICKHDMELSRSIVLSAVDEIEDADVVLDLFDPAQIGYIAVLARNYVQIPLAAFSQDEECDQPDEDDEFINHKEREFDAQASFVEQLTAISDSLRRVQPIERRTEVLEELLDTLEQQHLAPRNDEWAMGGNSVFVHAPLLSAGGGTKLNKLRLLRVLPREAKVFSTRSRAPTMLVFEACPAKSRPPASMTMANTPITHGIPIDPEEEDDLLDGELIMSAKLVSQRLRASSRAVLVKKESLMLDIMLCGMKEDDANSSGGGSDIGDDSTHDSSVDDNLAPPDDLLIQDARETYEDSTVGAYMSSFRSGDTSTGRSKWKRSIRSASPFGDVRGWTLVSLIAKSHDDLRQEVFAMQLMRNLVEIFENNELHDLYLRPYEILCTGANVGLIETLTDSLSVDAVKKQYGSLQEYFAELFGSPKDYRYQAAQSAFIQSTAASSLYCYLFQIKDRHNGNIMIDQQGHIMHIDFGFMMGSAPGGAFSLEDAPFKFTREMAEIMGGIGSRGHHEFMELFMEGFLAVRREYIKLVTLIHLATQESPFPCFQNQSSRQVLRGFRQRLFLNDSDDVARGKIRRLVDKSYNHWGTRQYDRFQHSSNGIL